MEQNKSGIGSIIGIVIIISIIILGGLYFWGKRVEESKLKQDLVSDNAQPVGEGQNEANVINGVSNSDELNSIETDLNSTNLDNLDTELSQ